MFIYILCARSIARDAAAAHHTRLSINFTSYCHVGDGYIDDGSSGKKTREKLGRTCCEGAYINMSIIVKYLHRTRVPPIGVYIYIVYIGTRVYYIVPSHGIYLLLYAVLQILCDSKFFWFGNIFKLRKTDQHENDLESS